MKNWKKFKLSDVCDTQYGFTTSATDEDTGTRFLRITDIAGDRLNWETVPFCEIEDREKAKYLLKEGDIVVARTGATVGFAKQMRHGLPNAVFASYLVRLTVKSGFDKRFIGCLVESTFYKDYINAIAGGAAQPNANAQDLVSLKLTLPPLSLQTRIAQILTRYDRLIENSEQQIAALEATAREVYREWFVRGRGLGRAVGEWEEKTVEECFEIMGGGTPSKEEPVFWEDGNINWFTPSDITAQNGVFIKNSSDKINNVGLQNSSARLFPPYSVMMTSRATIGALAINTQPATTNQGFIVCIPNRNFPFSFIYYWVFHHVPWFEIFATGSTFLEISKGEFKKFKIKVPPENVMEEYDKKVSPIFSRIENLQTQITHLRRTRDTLLPRLLSGQLTVTEAT